MTMDTSKLFFVLFSLLVFVFVPFIIKDARRYFLGLASFLHVFTSGWIFYHYTGLMLADLPILGLLVYSFFSGRRFRFFVGPAMLPFLGIIVLGSLSAAWSKEPGWALAEASKYGRIYLLIICLVHNIQSIRDLRLVLNSMLGGLLIEALIGVYQWKFGAVGIWFLGERAATWLVWRSTGTFFVPSYLANYLAMTVSVAFRMFIFYRPPKIRSSILYGAAGIAGFIALYTTYARGPWLAFLAAAAIVFLVSFINSKYKIRSSWGLPVLLLFIAVFAFRYHSQILDQFGTSRKTSYEMRFVHFQIAKRIIADRPLQGVGMGNYELNVRGYLNDEERAKNVAAVYFGMVHNSFLLFAAELGIPGGILFVLWFASILIVIVQILRARLNHPLIINFTLGILGGIVAMMIFLLSSPDIHDYSLIYQAGLFCGILFAERNILKQAAASRSQNPTTEKGLLSGS
jgi:O-antigen ligase